VVAMTMASPMNGRKSRPERQVASAPLLTCDDSL